VHKSSVNGEICGAVGWRRGKKPSPTAVAAGIPGWQTQGLGCLKCLFPSNQLRIVANGGELLVDATGELLALLQWVARRAGTFDVTLHQLIRVQIRGVARQKMQAQLAIVRSNVVALLATLALGQRIPNPRR